VVDPAPTVLRDLGDGFRVGVRVITNNVDGALLIPAGALFPHDGGFAVYLMDGSRARLQRVELGGRNGTSAWARNGVTAGQRVILYPPPAVADHKRVRVRTP
jgi:HlyD family secretion protein